MVSGKWGGLNILIRWIFPSDWFPPDQPIYPPRHRLFRRQASILPHTGKCQSERLKAIQQTIQPGQDNCPFPFSSLHLFLLLLIFLADLLTTIVGGRVLLTDIVTIFCIQSVSLTNSASKPSYRFAIKKAQNTFSSVA